MTIVLAVALALACTADAWLVWALMRVGRLYRLEQRRFAALAGEHADFLVELYNMNGLPMLSFYAASGDLSDHIFRAEENFTTARIRVVRLHGAKYDPIPKAAPPHPMESAGIPTFRDRLEH